MDLRPIDALPSTEERDAVDAVLGPADPERDGEARQRRHLLLPALRAVQDRVGWIGPGALGYISTRLSVPPAEAYGVVTFYAMLSTEPRPRTCIHVCDDIGCIRAGGPELLTALRDAPVGPEASVVPSPCLGLCDQAPAVLVQSPPEGADVALGRADRTSVDSAVRDAERAPLIEPERSAPQIGSDRSSLRLLRRIGVVDPDSLDSYRALGGYEALRRAAALGPDGVIREVKDAKLLGRGGAAFPTGVKWEAVARQAVQPHYFVCNADESEPGTFKDRLLMEHDPFALVEALTVAGFATGADKGFLYVRGEYPLAARRLRDAAHQCRRRGLLGDDVMGEGFAFDVEIRQGAGAYIAGEETALFNSIEGKRPEPRNKPPFPVTHGLFGKPTGVNNVETLVNVLEILRIGGPAFAEIGTTDSTGTRLFCLSGDVATPGVYEVEFGATLGDVLRLAGGVGHGRKLRAVLLGGAAGSFVGPESLDLPLTFEATRAAGVTLGSGVVMAFDDTADLDAVLLRIARFFRDESCGQCVPCRVGTVRQEEALHRLRSGNTLGTRQDEVRLLGEIAAAMRDASICGLGQTAAAATLSALGRLDVFADGGVR